MAPQVRLPEARWLLEAEPGRCLHRSAALGEHGGGQGHRGPLWEEGPPQGRPGGAPRPGPSSLCARVSCCCGSAAPARARRLVRTSRLCGWIWGAPGGDWGLVFCPEVCPTLPPALLDLLTGWGACDLLLSDGQRRSQGQWGSKGGGGQNAPFREAGAVKSHGPARGHQRPVCSYSNPPSAPAQRSLPGGGPRNVKMGPRGQGPRVVRRWGL